MKEIIQTDKAPAAIGPYSQAVKAGGFLFLSGQIPVDAVSGNVIQGDTALQTEQVISNIRGVLDEAGLSLADVVKTTVFLADMNDFASMNAVYSKYFNIDPPARSTIQVSRLPKDVNVEIEVIALLK
ncbi:RidA family protein [uncultured Desulfobulbus sp.]|uniref:RidA family protein n=1 Tax=uncultured Desulfobulbus sp. TaxID=239745 RepID=UPI0029C89FDC|nr:RidA family protein [uncultured Desulfobulbus sp.]